MATKYFVMISLAFVVIISIIQADIIKVLTKNTTYYGAIEIVPILCYAFFFFGFSNVIRGVGVRISGKTYYTTAIMVIGLCINIIMNFILIRQFGISGAAYSLLITFIVIFILSYIFSMKLYPVDHEIGKIVRYTTASVIIVIFSQISNTVNLQYDFIVRIFLLLSFFTYMYCWGISTNERKKIHLNIVTPCRNLYAKIKSNY